MVVAILFTGRQHSEWREPARSNPGSRPPDNRRSDDFFGAAKEARLFATGDDEGLPVNAATIRDEQRSYQTNHWLVRREPCAWPTDHA